MESNPSTSSADDPSNNQATKNLNSKYQKLAAEYAKLRSQLTVLKKAVLDEQQKQEVLKSTCTTQDQSIRKLEQELDSVTFRNRQLEKRIEILQQETTKQPVPTQQQPFIDSNLLLHVEQNKVLQEQLALLNEKYAQEVGRLRRMIDHEMVPRELMESLGKENGDRTVLLNRRVQELVDLNQELRARVESYEIEKCCADNKDDGVASSLEVDELVKRLTESELGREKLNSDVQILRLKLKRVMGSEELKSPVESVGSAGSDSMVGRVTLISECDNELLVNHLRCRVSELVRLLQLSDSKAVHYYSEAVNLCRLVRTGQVTFKRLDGEFGKLKGRFRGVCDELEDTKGVYERQVGCLTEHIALLNEKLAGVVEEVQVLKMGSGR